MVHAKLSACARLPRPRGTGTPRVDQFSRNKLVARVLVELGYIEEVGLGIRRIREELAQLGLPAPEFREEGFSFVITFPSSTPREASALPIDPLRALVDRGEISERQYRGFAYAQERGVIARRDYAGLTGVSARTAANDLADLVSKGLLVPIGQGRRTTYLLGSVSRP